jgi:hypothetical protein
VGDDLLDHPKLLDGRNELEFPVAAVRSVLAVEIEDTVMQLGSTWRMASSKVSAGDTSADFGRLSHRAEARFSGAFSN